MSIVCPSCNSEIAVEGDTVREVVCPSCGSSVVVDPSGTAAWLPSQAPSRLGKFEFIEQIGVGSFGTVYKARDTELDRIVAIKIPRSDSMPSDLDRFLREAKSAAQLKHPSIVSLFDAVTIDGKCCLISEYIQGATLAERQSGKRFNFQQAAEFVASVADALDYAHKHGVVHRDLKPSNIMLDMDGQPHLMDFGLAKRAADEITMTLEGQVLGTPAYMSPEQARGEGRRVDARTDIYSLGVILYELLSGELPFRGQTRMLIMQVIQDEPRPPRKLNDRIPRDLETICLKAMSKEPARRYPSSRDMGDDLRRFLAGEPIQARPIGQVEKSWRWMKRRPAIAGMSAAVVAITVIAFVLVTTQWLAADEARTSTETANQALEVKVKEEEAARKREEIARADADQKAKDEATARKNEAEERVKAETAQRAEAAERRKAQSRAYFLGLSLAHREWMVNNLERARQILSNCPAEYRAWEWHYLWKLCHLELLHVPGNIQRMAFSPDGKFLATIDVNRPRPKEKRAAQLRLRVIDVSSGKEVASATCDGTEVRAVVFSPDGKRVAASISNQTQNKPGLNSELVCWDAVKGDELYRMSANSRLLALAYSADGKQVTSVSDKGEIQFRDALTGKDLGSKQLDEPPAPTFFIMAIGLSEDGTKVAGQGRNGVVRIWDTATGKTSTVLAMPPRQLGLTFDIELSRDNSRIAVIDNTGIATVYDSATGQPIRSFPAASGVMASGRVTFSPDGRYIASNATDHSMKIWDLATGREIITMRGGGDEFGGVGDIVFSPEGFRVATINKQGLRLWDTTSIQERRELPRNGGMVKGVSFADNGRTLAVACERALNETGIVRISICDVISAQFRRFYLGHKADPVGVQFFPDGKRVASADQNGIVQIWEWNTGRVIKEFKVPAEVPLSPRVRSLMLSADGTHLAVGYVVKHQSNPKSSMRRDSIVESQIKVWNLEADRSPVVVDLKGEVEKVVITPDNKTVMAVTWIGTFRSWDLATSNLLKAFETEEGRVAISPDGSKLASAPYRIPDFGKDVEPTKIKIWNVAKGEVVQTMTARFSDGITMAFNPDGDRLAYSGGARDRFVTIYDVDSGHEALTLSGFRYAVSTMAFSADGRHLAAGGLDPIVVVWDAAEPTEDEQLRRRQTLERSLPKLHFRDGQLALQSGLKGPAFFHLDRAVIGIPNDGAVLARRGYAYAQFGDWDLANRDYTAAFAASKLPIKEWIEYVLVQLKRGDKEGYRKSCARLLASADKLTTPADINELVWTIVMGPGGVDDYSKVGALQQKVVDAVPQFYAAANTHGVVLYRAGKHEDAIKQLEKAIRLHGGGGTPGDWLFLAMANHRLGKKDETKKWLDKSKSWFDQAEKARERLRVVQPWADWQELLQMRQEAAETIR